jgi:hypothetical protein
MASSMFRLPLVLLLILSFMLPAFGSMAVGVPAEPCPMQGAMADHGQAASENPCCEHMDSAAKSFCKSGQECKSGSALQTLVVKALVPAHPRPRALPSQAVVQREPATRWRPPRLS